MNYYYMCVCIYTFHFISIWSLNLQYRMYRSFVYNLLTRHSLCIRFLGTAVDGLEPLTQVSSALVWLPSKLHCFWIHKARRTYSHMLICLRVTSFNNDHWWFLHDLNKSKILMPLLINLANETISNGKVIQTPH